MLPTPGCGATVIGRSSPARRIVIMKIRRLAKLIQRSSLTSPAAMSLHPVKHGSCLRTATAYLSSERERKTNYFRKHLSFSFAKASKAESCFVTTRTGKSTRLSTVETTKTLSSARLLTSKQSACSRRLMAIGHNLIAHEEHRPVFLMRWLRGASPYKPKTIARLFRFSFGKPDPPQQRPLPLRLPT